MTTHDLKVHPQFFAPLERGEKLFEIRKDDRPFEVGDWLKLREYKPANYIQATPAGYTGHRVLRQIAYILRAEDMDMPFEGDDPIGAGYVILGLCQPIQELGCKLKGLRLFCGTTDPVAAAELTQYLLDLSALVERTRDHAADAKKKLAKLKGKQS